MTIGRTVDGRKDRWKKEGEECVGVQRLKFIYSKLQIFTHSQNYTENKYVHAQSFTMTHNVIAKIYPPPLAPPLSVV